VRRLETRLVPAGEHDDSVTRLVGPVSTPLTSRVLSSNIVTGSASVLVSVAPGWSTAAPPAERERFIIIVGGSLVVDGVKLPPCSLVRVQPGYPGPELASSDGAELLVKVGGPQ